MLTCKTVYTAGKGLVEKHNALRRRYRHIGYNDDVQNLLQLLYLIAKDSIVAEYIETLDLSQMSDEF